jgi:hypothetical protein
MLGIGAKGSQFAAFFVTNRTCRDVESIRSVLPGPATDMVALFNDDSASGELMQTWAPLLDPWASYRTEIEEMMDLGDRVVSVICDYARRERTGLH